jgi:hypothetical protein
LRSICFSSRFLASTVKSILTSLTAHSATPLIGKTQRSGGVVCADEEDDDDAGPGPGTPLWLLCTTSEATDSAMIFGLEASKGKQNENEHNTKRVHCND